MVNDAQRRIFYKPFHLLSPRKESVYRTKYPASKEKFRNKIETIANHKMEKENKGYRGNVTTDTIQRYAEKDGKCYRNEIR